jgi:hypothetical protein
MQRNAIIGALLLIVVGVALGATVFRTDIAQATGLAQSVTVDNSPAQAVPVREQNLDGNGNIKVREQGVLRVRPAAPITSGGNAVSLPGGGEHELAGGPATATALSIHMTADVSWIELRLQGVGVPAFFYGPAFGGNSTIVLGLPQPITFGRITCSGPGSGRCSVSWVGGLP